VHPGQRPGAIDPHGEPARLEHLGVGYALWFDVLYIEGTVETGELDADWIITGYEDTESKDWVSWIEAYVDGKTLYVTINNAYPDVWYYVYFDIYNSGTIPLHVCGFNYDISNVGPGVGLYYWDADPLQVHPGDSASAGIAIYLDNNTVQNSTHTFTFEYVNVQYNEPCPAVDLPFS